ncbi:MAG: hypothetical protein ACR2G3_06715 [Solirubrobacterales bacterium]
MIAPTLLAAALAGAYLAWDPPSADLAAQTFRAELYAHEGFSVWNNAWYAGHHLPGYGLLSAPLAAWLTPQLVGAASAVASAGLFGAIAHRRWGSRARAGVMWFAAATVLPLLSGRLAFALGVALALAALLALQRRRGVWACALAVATTLASPVAGLFLAIAGLAVAIARRPGIGSRAECAGGLGTALAALASIGLLALAFPVGGVEPFAASAFWPVVGLCAAALVLLPGDERVLRWGVALYGLAAIALFSVDTAVGGNATRLGALFAGPVLALALAGRRPVVLAVISIPLLYWQVSPAVRDVADADHDPSVERAFHLPLLERLDSLVAGAPVRVHVVPTRNRWEAVHVAARYPLARGWLRQAESEDFELFDDANLTEDAYLAWLRERAVSYVAVPQGVELDYLGEDEAELIAEGVPFLEEVWASDAWRLYRVTPEPPLVSTVESPSSAAPDARLAALGPDSFVLTAGAAGSYLVRVHHTRYWEVVEGDACIEREGDWTRVEVTAPSVVKVRAELSLGGGGC